MASRSSESIRIQKNGHIVMDALYYLNEPSTLKRVVKQIAETHGVKTEDIKEPIKTVLQVGIDNGFLQRQNGKYSVCGLSECIECNHNNAQEYDEGTDSEEVDSCCPKKKKRRRCPRPMPCCPRPRRRKKRCR